MQKSYHQRRFGIADNPSGSGKILQYTYVAVFTDGETVEEGAPFSGTCRYAQDTLRSTVAIAADASGTPIASKTVADIVAEGMTLPDA